MINRYAQVYWILDVKKDANQAIETSEYWPLPANQGTLAVADADSIQLEQVPPIAGGDVIDEEAPTQCGAPFSPSMQKPEMTQLESQTQSLEDFRAYLFGTKGLRMQGNWTDLAGTSLAWMLLDFSFYLLGVNSARLVPDMFKKPKMPNMPDVSGDKTPYDLIFNRSWHGLVATSIGAVLGGAIAIKIMNNFSRKNIQMWSFLVLGILFVIMGILYIKTLETSGAVVIVAVYVLCQLTFNIGMHLRGVWTYLC